MDISITVKYGRKKEKVFDVAIVPNKFNVLYSEYFESSKEVYKLSSELQQASTKDEVYKIQDKLKKLDLNAILDQKYELIKSVLIANEYEFDREWWDTMADPADMEHFIVECVFKDRPTDAKKKELQAMLAF